MRFLSSLLMTSIMILAFSTQAQAGLRDGARVAVVETKETIDDLTNVQIRARLHKVVSAMILKGTRALAEAGHAPQANQILREWRVVEEQIFKRVGALGDHRPLNQWLARTYKTMELFLGKSRMSELHLDDINIINYAVPVVISPNQGWSKGEYGAHFVPLAGVVVYWSGFGACMYVFNTNQNAAGYCDRVAMVLKRGIHADIAPMLSNFVFDRFNVRNFLGVFEITNEQLARRYGPELSRVQ